MRSLARTTGWGVGVVALVVAGCTAEPTGPGPEREEDARASDADVGDVRADTRSSGRDVGRGDAVADTRDGGELPPVSVSPECDSLLEAHCALPWPSPKFLEADDDRTTGYTLSFGDSTLPAPSGGGESVDPAPYRRLDGYGVGTPLMVAYRDLEAGPLPNENEIAESMDEDAPIALFRVDGEQLERVPYWAELDAKADEEADRRMLLIRPAVILQEASRYVVAIRQLDREDGSGVEPSAAFERLRAGRTEGTALAERQAHFDEVFGLLEGAGLERDELLLAWDFRTASSEALHGRMLEMRDRGFEATGSRGPELTIEQVERFVPEDDETDRPVDDDKALAVTGTFRVPRFVEEDRIEGTSGWRFHLDEDGELAQNGWKESPFWLVVPHSAINAAPEGPATGNGEAHGLVQYGHGLLGTGAQTDGGFNNEIANTHDLIFFGSNLFGMAESDRQVALGAVRNISRFVFMADRLHQGMLEYLLLARAMRERLAETDLADEYDLSVASEETYYSGISQGGIFGGTYMALSQDVTRGHLGVPGNNYSLLLERSVNFEPFFTMMEQTYPERLEQLVGLATMQQLWGQTDPVSYMRHIKAEPFAETPAHDVLLAPAKGDHQVAPLTNEIVARTEIGIELMANYPREVDLVEPEPFPHDGSGIVLYDFGNPWPAPGNRPPDDETSDPHGEPREAEWHNRQMVHFFRTGEIINTCEADGDPVCDPD